MSQDVRVSRKSEARTDGRCATVNAPPAREGRAA